MVISCKVCGEAVNPCLGYDFAACSLNHRNLGPRMEANAVSIDSTTDGWIDRPDSFGSWVGITEQGDTYFTVVKTEYDLRRCNDPKFRWHKISLPQNPVWAKPATDAEIAAAAREYVAARMDPDSICRLIENREKLFDLVNGK